MRFRFVEPLEGAASVRGTQTHSEGVDVKTEHVSPGYDNFPAWSPRGDLISFTSFRNGDFDVRGKYMPEHGGPIRNDEESTSLSVRYVGHAIDNELTLTVTIPDKKETVGTYNLTHGSEGRVMKCR